MTPVSAETMRRLDAMAVQKGISNLTLMENAGSEIADKAGELLKSLKGSGVAIFCGKGNNGGDGFVTARKLKTLEIDVDVYLLCRPDEVKNEAAVNLRAYIESGGNVREICSESDADDLCKSIEASLIIDALLGTGFSGKVKGVLKTLIESLNSSDMPILAIDVPSGLNATTGEIDPVAIKAKWTVSFALPKKGFYKNRGSDHTGSIEVRNIGFPEALLEEAIKYEASLCAT